jgi:hypothetical protein
MGKNFSYGKNCMDLVYKSNHCSYNDDRSIAFEAIKERQNNIIRHLDNQQ